MRGRPASWRSQASELRGERYVYNAVGHALSKHRPAYYVDDPRPGQLIQRLDAVAGEMPELPQVRASVELVDRLRTTYLPRGVTRWLVELKALHSVVDKCGRVSSRLQEVEGNSLAPEDDVATSGAKT